ncbi:hypothetical protein EVAR_54348_1 [Eumeta japonica]|uniref:Helitron helicase-like domain-containing protein n=1 Tax=Eumeta variegata TaxID=151549 RepID=A0A4C1Z3I4_EUMVA|nr:hypothetical protein EVAR_54348_1 [Eumeta japonica]
MRSGGGARRARDACGRAPCINYDSRFDNFNCSSRFAATRRAPIRRWKMTLRVFDTTMLVCTDDCLNRRSNLGRRTRNATNQANYRSNRTAQERDDGNERERIRISQTREARARHSTNNRASLNRAAFSYDVSIDYSNYQCVVIGSMNSVCSHCSETNKSQFNELLFIPPNDSENEDNHILKCRRLYHKYVVDMYVKIETERLTFIRLNQTKLRSEEYIHLRDAINTDGNAQNVGRMTILPAYIGSPRHMHEYAQDAMSYVRHYGTADLFITFTCNPQWIEIKQELFLGNHPLIVMILQPESLDKVEIFNGFHRKT